MTNEVKLEKLTSPDNTVRSIIANFDHIRFICVLIYGTKNQERRMMVNKKEIF